MSGWGRVRRSSHGLRGRSWHGICLVYGHLTTRVLLVPCPADNESKWRQLGELALANGKLDVAQQVCAAAGVGPLPCSDG